MNDIFKHLQDLLNSAHALVVAIGAVIAASGVFASETATKICEGFQFSSPTECRSSPLTWTAFDTCYVALVALLIVTALMLVLILSLSDRE